MHALLLKRDLTLAYRTSLLVALLTHNWVERLLRSGIPDMTKVHPEWQHLEVGDLMRAPVAQVWPVSQVPERRCGL